MAYKTILCIPDIQAPFHYKDTVGFLEYLKKHYKPDLIACLGDELDQYTLSHYPHDPDADSAGREYAKAMEVWKEIYALFPKAIAVTSNHVARVSKKAIDSGIPAAYLRTVHEFMAAPKGWEWRDSWKIDGIKFEHGERATGQIGLRNLVVANMCSTCIGHHHESPGTTWISNGDKVIWGLNVGCLINENTHGMAYTKKNRYKPVLGAGVIVGGTPMFVPL